MPTIQNIAAGSLVRGEGGFRHTVVHLVEGLTGSGLRRLLSALDAQGIPQDGEPHPEIPDIRVIETSVDPAGRDPDVARVTVVYGVPEQGSDAANELGTGGVEFSTETVADTTIRDRQGRLLQTFYRSSLISFRIRTHQLDIDKALFTVRIPKTESSLPKAKADLANRVNSKTWSGYPAQTWLYRGLSASQDAKGKFRVVYTFTYKPETWRAVINQRVDGLIPDDVKEGNGQTTVEVYDLLDFNAKLGVSF